MTCSTAAVIQHPKVQPGAGSGAVGWGTAPQDGSSRVRENLSDLILLFAFSSPRIHSASNRNEYQGISLGVKCGSTPWLWVTTPPKSINVCLICLTLFCNVGIKSWADQTHCHGCKGVNVESLITSWNKTEGPARGSWSRSTWTHLERQSTKKIVTTATRMAVRK
jgi:hypothetical protein